MAEHLLKSDNKDAAAVIIGVLLEEHLRQLRTNNKIDVANEKDGKLIPLKAKRINSKPDKVGIYNKIDQNGVTAQLDLRNNAAHGNYSKYDKRQVEMMYDFVLNFISKYQNRITKKVLTTCIAHCLLCVYSENPADFTLARFFINLALSQNNAPWHEHVMHN
tara:strand:- start:834 stop:1319 length:486 start_codon:yes stop_codon:yes gene_type:complete